MKLSNLAILSGILFLAFALRSYKINSNPVELLNDEVVGFASVRSVIETGVDLGGKKSFLFLYDRIAYRPPMLGVLQYVSAKIFGVNAFAMRFPGVILGVVAIWLLYLLRD